MNTNKRAVALLLILCLLFSLPCVSAEEMIDTVFDEEIPLGEPTETPTPLPTFSIPEIVISTENGRTELRLSQETDNSIYWQVYMTSDDDWQTVCEGSVYAPENTETLRVRAVIEDENGLTLTDEITVSPCNVEPQATETPCPVLPAETEAPKASLFANAVRELGGGKSLTLPVKVNGKTVSARSLEWKSSDTSVATVRYGKVTAKKVTAIQECVITARLKSAPYTTSSVRIIVHPAVKTVSIKAPAKTIDIAADDKTLSLSAACSPSTALQKVTWKSSSTKIATVSSDGVVTAVKPGKVRITATAADGTKKAASVTLYVIKAVHGLTLSGVSELAGGKTAKLTARFTPGDATNKKLTWHSSDTTIATVSSSGVVKARKLTERKEVTITAVSQENNAIVASHTLTIVPLTTSVQLSTKGATLYTSSPQNALQLYAVCAPSTAMQKVTWKSSNKKVASVSSDGYVTGLKEGTAKITATAADGSGKKATVTITVKKHAPVTIKYRALLIGQEYSGSSSLNGSCLRDANLMQTLLSKGSVTKYTGNNVKSISMNKLSAQIQTTFADTTENDVCLFYYSGHGTTGGYLVGSDSTYCSPKQLRSYLNAVKGTKIVIVDACHSGSLIGKTLSDVSASDSFVSNFVSGFMTSEKSLYDLADHGFYVLTACSGSQLSYTGSGTYSDSLFTHYLLAGAGLSYNTQTQATSSCTRYADSNKDGGISILEAFNYIRSKTETQQSAQYYASDGNTGFVFFK